MRTDLARPLAVGDKLNIVREDARSKIARRVVGLRAKGGVSLRLARHADPPPIGTRRRGRGRSPAGERALAFLKFN
jgi:hypothetical protein